MRFAVKKKISIIMCISQKQSKYYTVISSESTKRDFTVFSPLVTHESTKKLLPLKSLYYLQKHKYGSALHTCTHELFSFIYSIIQPPPPLLRFITK